MSTGESIIISAPSKSAIVLNPQRTPITGKFEFLPVATSTSLSPT